jgi:CheY-like chemotaxis protein
MTNKNNRTVLVVEDNPDIAESYRFHLERVGYTVDIVDRKKMAIEYLRRRIYDAAIVDLQLKDDITHKGGLDVVSVISDLQEGTKAVVISGTAEVWDTVQSYRRGTTSYFTKDELTAKSLIEELDRILLNHVRSLFGDFGSLSAYLAAPESTPIWEAHVEQVLGCGYASMQKILWKGLQRFVPVLRLRDGTPSFQLDASRHAIGGLFWSKSAGHAIWFSASSKEAFIPPPESPAEQLRSEEAKGVVAGVWKANADRDLFLERISDRPAPQKRNN